MREVVFVDAARTPFCRIGGSLKEKIAADLGILSLQALLDKSGIMEKDKLGAVMAGTANTDANCRHLARYVTLGTSLPLPTSSSSIEMQEGTAIAAMNYAAGKIALGLEDSVAVGGVDSWSRKPAYMKMDTEPYKLIPPMAIMHKMSPYENQDLDEIEISDYIARIWNISRTECDELAAMSCEKYAQAAQKAGFASEIIPFVIPATKKTPEITVASDDAFKLDMDELGAQESVYWDGIATEGNVAHYADGAGWILMMSAEKAAELGYKPFAKWVMGAEAACEPNLTGAGAAYAGLKALAQAGLTVKDIDIWQNYEITAAYDICAKKEIQRASGTKIDPLKWNRNGGALAVGQTGGAEGIRMTADAFRMLAEGGRYAVIGSSCAGGQGTSMIIEKC